MNNWKLRCFSARNRVIKHQPFGILRLGPDASDVGAQHAAPQLARAYESTHSPHSLSDFLRGRNDNHCSTGPPLPFRCTVSTQVTMPREPSLCQFGRLIFVCDGNDLRTTEDCRIVAL